MEERFLHYIWKFQKFSKSELSTTSGQVVVVFNQGNHNHNSGPDFEEARIKVGEVEWAGSVEIHINSSDWTRHNHHHDKAYNNVILHVVWKDDKPLQQGGELIPTIELNRLVDLRYFEEYQRFISQNKEILCVDQLQAISDINFSSTLDRMLAERLEQKSQLVNDLQRENNQDWESTTYQSLAKNFGFSTNSDCFLLLARSLPKKVISKYHGITKSTEALIFGQAGFLEQATDPYQIELQAEYQYLKNKHQLQLKVSKEMWKFGRMRPANFPTIRLAQFSGLLCNNQNLFSSLIEIEKQEELIKKFQVDVSDYWLKHYDFGKEKKKPSANLGQSTQENILINTIAPLLASYSKYTGDQQYMDRAIKLLEHLNAETNTITKKWEVVGKKAKTAFDSQAMIGLYKNYCTKKNCLNCSIGIEILGR